MIQSTLFDRYIWMSGKQYKGKDRAPVEESESADKIVIEIEAVL